MRYSIERKQALLTKLSQPYNCPITDVAAEEGVSHGAPCLYSPLLCDS